MKNWAIISLMLMSVPALAGEFSHPTCKVAKLLLPQYMISDTVKIVRIKDGLRSKGYIFDETTETSALENHFEIIIKKSRLRDFAAKLPNKNDIVILTDYRANLRDAVCRNGKCRLRWGGGPRWYQIGLVQGQNVLRNKYKYKDVTPYSEDAFFEQYISKFPTCIPTGVDQNAAP